MGKAPQTWKRCLRLDPALGEALEAAGVDSLASLSSRQRGEVVTDHRSSWVRRWTDSSIPFYVKCYDYPGVRDRLRAGVLVLDDGDTKAAIITMDTVFAWDEMVKIHSMLKKKGLKNVICQTERGHIGPEL